VGVALGMAMTVFGARPGIVSGWLASVAHGLVACPVAFARGRAAVTFVSLCFLLYGEGTNEVLSQG